MTSLFESVVLGFSMPADLVPVVDRAARDTDKEGQLVPVRTYKNPRRPAWDEADYVIGNPPFIGGKDMRGRLPPGYAEALWQAHPHINQSADYVMFWWDRAADLLTCKGSRLNRFGLVSTNSITQAFSRRVMAKHLKAKKPISLLMAIPDHPWTKATKDAAAVRIAMTVAAAGTHEGVLREVAREADLDTDTPLVELVEHRGRNQPRPHGRRGCDNRSALEGDRRPCLPRHVTTRIRVYCHSTTSGVAGPRSKVRARTARPRVPQRPRPNTPSARRHGDRPVRPLGGRGSAPLP
jgi:hypothetical protein